MGLVLKPSEVKSAAQQMRANIVGNRTGYSNVLQVIQRFAENEDLNSESWNTAKFNMSVAHQLIMQGMQAAQEAILQDLNTLEASIGEEDLDEDELIADIERLTNECICYEEAIRNLQRMGARSILNGYAGIQTAIGNYKALLEHTRAELELMKEKLEKLRETSQITAELLNSSEPLLQAIENAINDAEVYITGTGTFSDGEWRMVIPQIIKDKNEDSRKTELSQAGYEFLVALELGKDWEKASFIKTDESGNIVEIKNHNVGDGGITVGVGIYVNKSYTERIKMLENLGITWDDTNQWVPYNLILQAFNNISGDYNDTVNNTIEKYNLSVTQEQYDALFAMAYNRAALFYEGGAVDKLLADGNNNIEDWRDALLGEYRSLNNWNNFGNQWSKRIEDELELYFKGDYVKDHE